MSRSVKMFLYLILGLSFNAAPSITDSKINIRVIPVDGGGIRGVIPAIILYEIEKRASQKAGKAVRIADLFDVMAGTSTGGIITLALGAPQNYAASKVVDLYLNEGDSIFFFLAVPPYYNPWRCSGE